MTRSLLISLCFIMLVPMVAKAAPMRTFLTSCAYGAGAGAVVGLTALAFSDRPSENLSNVARGASLGLYVGMGVGLYMISQPEANQSAGPTPWIVPTTDGVAAGFHQTF